MEDVITFASHHLALVIAAAILLFLLLIIEILRLRKGGAQLKPLEVTQYINRQNAVVLDIRSKEVYQKGHIINALSITPEMLKTTKTLEKFKSKPLIVVCGSGNESQKIALQLKKQGYNAYFLSGGIRSWTEAQMPLVKE